MASPSPESALAVPLTPAQQNEENTRKLDRMVTELLVSSYDPVVGKTIWQCAQCHFSSKIRYTVREHIETHIQGFTHQCPQCVKTCKTRNALRAHVMRAHSVRPAKVPSQQQSWQLEPQSPEISPDGMMQVQFQEMGEPLMKAPRRPRQKRPWDEELERQIRLLLISTYDPVEVKTSWSCAQCNYTSKLQYTVKQHIETHITSIVHQCVQCPKILKTRNALRAHMNQKHEPALPKRVQHVATPWMGGGGGDSSYNSPRPAPQTIVYQNQMQAQQQPRQRRKRSEMRSAQTPMEVELDRQVNELMVSNYDAVIGKTSWQCAQCHFSSKVRSTVKEHIETHISGFTHPCTMCAKTCKTRNALRVHTIRAHNKLNDQMGQQQQQQVIRNNNNPPTPKISICYDPQQQVITPLSVQQNMQQQPIAKKSEVPEQKPQIMYVQIAQKQDDVAKPQIQISIEQPRQAGGMNSAMAGRTTYGQPVMMGHPMI